MPGESEQDIIANVVPPIPQIVPKFKPDILIIQMGVDGHREDPMSQIDMGERFYTSVSSVLARCSRRQKFPIVLLGGGGFNFPKTAQLWRMIVEAFAKEQ